jgi:hypothetical protein
MRHHPIRSIPLAARCTLALALLLTLAVTAACGGLATTASTDETPPAEPGGPSVEPPPEMEPDGETGELVEPWLRELDEARARWEALGLERYTIELSRGCFCPVEFVGPFRVMVADGRIESVEYAPGGPKGKPPAEATRFIPSVEGLFAEIEEANVTGAAEVRVTYDLETGVPTDIYIDQIAEAVDEEISYEVRLLES